MDMLLQNLNFCTEQGFLPALVQGGVFLPAPGKLCNPQGQLVPDFFGQGGLEFQVFCLQIPCGWKENSPYETHRLSLSIYGDPGAVYGKSRTGYGPGISEKHLLEIFGNQPIVDPHHTLRGIFRLEDNFYVHRKFGIVFGQIQHQFPLLDALYTAVEIQTYGFQAEGI